MAFHIHITGTSGSGVTTLGRAMAVAMGGLALDTDDFYWIPTFPPFQIKRAEHERLRLLRDALPRDRPLVMTGTGDAWAAPLVPPYDLVVFLRVPTEVRIARLRERERHRVVDAAIESGGHFHQNHEEFIAWAAQYDFGTQPARSLPRHERWLATLTCPVLRLDGELPVHALVDRVLAALNS